MKKYFYISIIIFVCIPIIHEVINFNKFGRLSDLFPELEKEFDGLVVNTKEVELRSQTAIKKGSVISIRKYYAPKDINGFFEVVKKTASSLGYHASSFSNEDLLMCKDHGLLKEIHLNKDYNEVYLHFTWRFPTLFENGCAAN